MSDKIKDWFLLILVVAFCFLLFFILKPLTLGMGI
jgi:hypothetical protein